MAAGLTTACGDSGGEAGSGTDDSDAQTHRSTPTETLVPTPAPAPREPILIRTRVTRFKGKVLDGSVMGDSPFCPRGTVRHEFGSPEIGFPAINVFRCADGQLRIGFGPGPDQMNQAIQVSSWEILDGSGRFAGIRGNGQMKVRFERAGGSKGKETFKGEVFLP
jgi:hypothetical protein